MASDKPTLPNPSTWSDGLFVPAPTLRSDVSNTIDLLTGPPAFSGAQLVTTQNITNNLFQGVDIDAEYLDEWNGHRQVPDSGNYYSPLAGYYLCESGVAFPSAGAGACSAGIQYETAGGALTFTGGQFVPFNGSRNTGVVAARLLPQTDIVQFGFGDFTGPGAFQNSGATITLPNAATQFPYYQTRWVSAFAGTDFLPVPVNAAFPSPPSVLTGAFMNTNIRDTINYLIYPPIMEAQYNGGTATLASAASFPQPGVQFRMDTVNVDNYLAYSTGTGNWTAPAAGIYYCYAQTALTAAAGAQATATGLTVTSANYNGGAKFTMWGGAQSMLPSKINCSVARRRIRLNAGDTVSNTGYYRDSASAAAVLAGVATQWTTRFLTVWEGA